MYDGRGRDAYTADESVEMLALIPGRQSNAVERNGIRLQFKEYPSVAYRAPYVCQLQMGMLPCVACPYTTT